MEDGKEGFGQRGWIWREVEDLGRGRELEEIVE